MFSFINRNATIGTIGNALGKSPYPHHSTITLVSYVWNNDSGQQGWKKMFYLNLIVDVEN